LEVDGAAGQQVGLMVAVVLLPSAELSSILLVDDALDCSIVYTCDPLLVLGKKLYAWKTMHHIT
jgi:hypothetical protein